MRLCRDGLRCVVLGHLSAETNSPELAFETVCAALRAAGAEPGDDVRVDMAWRERMGRFYAL